MAELAPTLQHTVLLVLLSSTLFIVAVGTSASAAGSRPVFCPNETKDVYGQVWRTRSAAGGCVLAPVPAAGRASATDVNLVVVSPYSGPLGPVVPTAYPFLQMAVQEIENQSYLGPYRLNLELVDSKCDREYACRQALGAMYAGKEKHGVIGDSCSDGCQGITSALQAFNVMFLSPFCMGTSLSVGSKYPYFTRLSTSLEVTIVAIADLFLLFPWRRVAILHGYEEICEATKDLVVMTIGIGQYVNLMVAPVNDETNSSKAARMADEAAEMVKKTDARVIIDIFYEDAAVTTFCAFYKHGLLPPSFVHIVVSGWWEQRFVTRYGNATACSEEQLLHASFGAIGANRPVISSTDASTHSLSGRVVKDVLAQYHHECRGSGGTSFCDDSRGYFYDAVWQFAEVLRLFLLNESRPLSEVTTPAGRHRMFSLSLGLKYDSLSGPVRFRPKSGDRAESCTFWQLRGRPGRDDPFVAVAHWSARNVTFVAPLQWDPHNESVRVNCSALTCNPTVLGGGWIPKDRSEKCSDGSEWTKEKGCTECVRGKFRDPSATTCESCPLGKSSTRSGESECLQCGVGTFSNQKGASACIPCQKGSYQNKGGQSACHYCQIGSYAHEEQLSRCLSCADLEPPGDANRAAARSRTRSIASKDPSDCACQEDEYWPLDQTGCRKCTEGLTCEVGAKEKDIPTSKGFLPALGANYPKVRRGYFSTYDKPLYIYKCSHEEQCPGDLPESCAPHHEALACGRCERNHFMDGTTCKACASIHVASAVLAFMPVVLGPPAALGYAYLSSDMASWNDPLNGLFSIGYVAMVYMQTIGMHSLVNTKYPGSFSSTSNSLSILVVPLSMMHPDCAGGFDYSLIVIARMCAPLYVMLVFVLAYVLNRVIHRFRPGCPLLGDFVVSCYGSFHITLFMTIAAEACQVFMCTEHPNGKSSIKGAAHVLCWEGSWNFMVSVSVGAILLFCVGAVAIMAWLLWVAPKHYERLSFRKRTKFLMFRFRTEYGFWSIVLLIRGLAVILSFALFSEAYQQVMCLNSVLVLYAVATANTYPFRAMASSVLDIAAHVWCFCVYYCTTLLVEVKPGAEAMQGQVATVVALSMFAFCVVALCWQAWMMYWQPRYAEEHHKRMSARICRAMGMLSPQPMKVAELMNYLSYVEISLFQRAAFMTRREAGLEGAVRSTTGMVRKSALDHLVQVADQMEISNSPSDFFFNRGNFPLLARWGGRVFSTRFMSSGSSSHEITSVPTERDSKPSSKDDRQVSFGDQQEASAPETGLAKPQEDEPRNKEVILHSKEELQARVLSTLI